MPQRLTTCPNCGEPRVGQFRFCRICGLDYDVAERAALPGGSSWRSPSDVDHAAGSSIVRRTDRSAPGEAGRFRAGSEEDGGLRLTRNQLVGIALTIGGAAAIVVSLLSR
jgi:hypothetical protein